jgi:hypothetical protein
MEKLTCKETAVRFMLNQNSISNYVREGKIDGQKDNMTTSRGIRKIQWIIFLTKKTIDYLEKRSSMIKPKTVKVKRMHNKTFAGDCYEYVNNAMGAYLANYYNELPKQRELDYPVTSLNMKNILD